VHLRTHDVFDWCRSLIRTPFDGRRDPRFY
jgi:hypothetical protein